MAVAATLCSLFFMSSAHPLIRTCAGRPEKDDLRVGRLVVDVPQHGGKPVRGIGEVLLHGGVGRASRGEVTATTPRCRRSWHRERHQGGVRVEGSPSLAGSPRRSGRANRASRRRCPRSTGPCRTNRPRCTPPSGSPTSCPESPRGSRPRSTSWGDSSCAPGIGAAQAGVPGMPRGGLAADRGPDRDRSATRGPGHRDPHPAADDVRTGAVKRRPPQGRGPTRGAACGQPPPAGRGPPPPTAN